MELKPCSTNKYKDGYCWICPTGGATLAHTRSVRVDSALFNTKISFSSFLQLLWMFCNGVSVCTCARILSFNTKTVRSLFKSLRQCMAEDLLENGARIKIGGPGHIVEIDECKFGKRKYDRGRRVLGKWILGEYCRTSGQCFLEECTGNKRDHHALLQLIKKNVAPGTIIPTDKWKAYNQLSRHGYAHLTVTRVHQGAEVFMMCTKKAVHQVSVRFASG
jgi:hypothetical protein